MIIRLSQDHDHDASLHLPMLGAASPGASPEGPGTGTSSPQSTFSKVLLPGREELRVGDPKIQKTHGSW